MFSIQNFGSMMTDSSAWSVGNFLNNLNSTLTTWGTALMTVIGLVMVIVAVVKIAKGLMSSGRGQTNWVLNIVLFFLGGALAFSGGWGLMEDISKGGGDTLNELGTSGGMIIPYIAQLF